MSTSNKDKNYEGIYTIYTYCSKRSFASLNTEPEEYSSMPGTCPRCSKQVYFAEEIKAKEEVFHKLCFNCSSCKKLLGPGNFSENDGNIYCKTCYG